MNLKNSNIILTGGGGFLGKRVRATLEDAGANVVVPRSVDYDLRFQIDTAALYTDTQSKVGPINCIIHAAATVGGIGATGTRPADFLMDNAMMGLNIIRGAYIFDIPKVVVIGSVCSYPKVTPVPFNEANLWEGYPEETNAPYGNAKRIVGEALMAYNKQYSLGGAYLLMANMYGPGDNFDDSTSHVIPALIKKFYHAKINDLPNVEIWGSGRASRDFLYIQDAAEAVVMATERDMKPTPINIGTGEETNILFLSEYIKKYIGYEGSIIHDRSKPDGQMRRSVQTARAREFLEWKSSVSLQDGLAGTIDWYIQKEENNG